MKKSTLRARRSPELAKTVEAWLTTILNSIDGVKNVHGCSFDTYQDFKVIFDYGGSEEAVSGCFLSFLPEGKDYNFKEEHSSLEAWTGGLATYWPKAVMRELERMFPHSSYRNVRGSGRDPWHYWLFVTEEDIEALAQQLSA